MWIKRDLEAVLLKKAAGLKLFPVWLLLGPRQVGKSSLLKKCSAANRTYINLDDLKLRQLASQDPQLFLSNYKPPILIDEIQYAPQLLSSIKMWVDAGLPPGSIWLTGSQHFEVMKGVQESLAGRVAVLHLLGLSDHEKNSSLNNSKHYFSELFQGNFPKIFSEKNKSGLELFFSSYVQTYVERDIGEIIGLQKRREFEIFLKVCALRTGQIINYDAMARDVGVSPQTFKTWVKVLEDSFLIKLLHPYFNNRNKRLVKNPKLFFLDMGLAAHLGGWQSAEILLHGPMSGASFESHVFSNLLKLFYHQAKQDRIHFWRTRDGEEIDFLVETPKGILPVEIKLGLPKTAHLPRLKGLKQTEQNMPVLNGVILTLGLAPNDAPLKLNQDWMAQHPSTFFSSYYQSKF